METTTASQLARRLMNEHGLGDWVFTFDRAKTRRGWCHSGSRTIGMSEPLTRLADERTVRNTILHEIAHALAGPGHGHDAVWRRKALAIGCDGRRCCADEPQVRQAAKWRAVCSCGRKYHRHRLTQRVRDLGRCGSCGSALTWVDRGPIAAQKVVDIGPRLR